MFSLYTMSIHPSQDDQTHLNVLDDHVKLKDLVGRGGLEPPTSRLSGVRSNHLSYRPTCRALALK